MNDDISFEELNTLGDAQWRDILTAEWEQDYVSLSAAVWWIALSGQPGECDDNDLESAATTLLRQARSKESPLAIMGRRGSASSRETVPRNDLSDAMPFIGMDEGKFLSGVPCVRWRPMLEDDHGDVVAYRDGKEEWCDLSIEREDMLRIWPAIHSDDAAWIAELESRINANPALTQSDAIVAMKNFCSERGINITEKPIKTAWKRAKGIDGKAKTGPVRPRAKAR